MSEILVITDTPLDQGYKGMKINYVGKTMSALGADWTHASVFPTMPDNELRKVKADAWNEQTARLRKLAKGKKVLAMGGLPVAALHGLAKVPAVKKIEGLGFWSPAGELVTDHEAYTVATYNASTPMKDPEFYRDVLFAARKLVRYDAPSAQPHFWKVPLHELMDEPVLACDIETTGFSPVDDTLISVGFATPSGSYAVVDGKDVFRIREFIDEYAGTLVFHNLKFDVPRLQRWLGVTREEGYADTMLMHYLLDERSEGKFKAHGLKRLARLYFDAPDYGDGAVEGYLAGDVSREDFDFYLAQDVVYTARLYEALRFELDEESPRFNTLHSDFMVPAAIAVGHMECNGIKINRPFLEEMQGRLSEELGQDLHSIQQAVFALTGEEEFNPGSSPQLGRVMYGELGLPKIKGKSDWKRKTDAPSTEKTVLKTLAHRVRKDRPEVAALIDRILLWRQKGKILSTYVDNILSRIHSDGRLRGDFGLANTVTGRISCSKPNLQNIDSRGAAIGADVKEAFIAEDGWSFIEADFSQLELRVAALFSADPKMVNTFRQDEDIHQTVAWELFHKPKDEVSKHERVLAKTVSFGSIYGLSAEGLYNSEVMVALEDQGIERWSIPQIENFQGSFKRGFFVLFNWMEKVKARAARQKYVDNPLGFRRRWLFVRPWDTGGMGRQAVNAPIQGFAGQITLWALVQLRRRLDASRARTVLTVHDSILVEARDEYVEEAQRIVLDVMENELPRDVVDPLTGKALDYFVPIRAEATVGKTWSSTK